MTLLTNPHFDNTFEGGMFVELWIVPKEGREQETDFIACCGVGEFSSLCSEVIVGTDNPKYSQAEIFPHLNPFISENFHSIPLLGGLTLGSTGWSGRDKEAKCWVCQYDDLNEQGKSLYDSLLKLYRDFAALVLVTWLDT